MPLSEDIAGWDTKDATHIKRVYASHYKHTSFHPDLISLFHSSEHQDGATWLFKHALDEGDIVPESIDPDLIIAMCEILSELRSWPAQLHALQILAVVPIPPSCTQLVEDFARDCMHSKKNFVRAWSYTALFRATQHDPKKHAKAVKLLNDTLSDDSAPASVKARIRNTLKST